MKQAKRFNAHMEHVPSDENDLAISFINSGNFGWKADVCKLQKHHADYGSHCDGEANLLAQVDSSSWKDEKKPNTTAPAAAPAPAKVVEKPKPKFGDNSPEFKKALEKV